ADGGAGTGYIGGRAGQAAELRGGRQADGGLLAHAAHGRRDGGVLAAADGSRSRSKGRASLSGRNGYAGGYGEQSVAAYQGDDYRAGGGAVQGCGTGA